MTALSAKLCSAVEKLFPDSSDCKRAMRGLALFGDETDHELLLLSSWGDIEKLEEMIDICIQDIDDYRTFIVVTESELRPLSNQEIFRRCDDLGFQVPSLWSENTLQRIAEKAREFIAKELILAPNQVISTLDIREQIQVLDFDGPAFIAGFAKKFGVDTSEFRSEDYFFKRPTGFFEMLSRKSQKVKLKPLFVADLIAAAQSKKF